MAVSVGGLMGYFGFWRRAPCPKCGAWNSQLSPYQIVTFECTGGLRDWHPKYIYQRAFKLSPNDASSEKD